jgi:hypothetical protein
MKILREANQDVPPQLAELSRFPATSGNLITLFTRIKNILSTGGKQRFGGGGRFNPYGRPSGGRF